MSTSKRWIKAIEEASSEADLLLQSLDHKTPLLDPQRRGKDGQARRRPNFHSCGVAEGRRTIRRKISTEIGNAT